MTTFAIDGINKDWTPIQLAYARYLRTTTETTDIATTARSVTAKRILGDGVNIDLADDDDHSLETMKEFVPSGKRASTDSDSDSDDAAPSDDRNRKLMRNAARRQYMKGGGTAPSSGGRAKNVIQLSAIIAPIQVELDEFVETLDKEIVRQGFALVGSRASRHHPELLVPFVEDIEYYSLYHRYTPLVGWEYQAVWSGLSQRQQELLGKKNDQPIDDVMVLVAPDWQPMPTGQLRSKLATAAPLIAEVSSMEENASYALYWASHPVYVPQLAPTGPGTSKGNAAAAAARVAAPPYGNYTQLLQDRSALDRYSRNQKLDDSREVADDALRRHLKHQAGRLAERLDAYQRHMSHNNSVVSAALDANARHAIRPPFIQDYPMEQGDKIAAGPTPTLPGQIREQKNDIARRAYMVLDTHPQLVTLEHSNHAANSDIAFAWQNDAIKARQAMLEPLIAEAFRFVYKVDLDMAETALGGEPSVVEHARGARRLAPAPTQPVRLAHRIRARLSTTPMITTAALEHMLKTHVVDHQTYREMYLQNAQVSPMLASQHRVSHSDVDLWYGNVKPTTEATTGASEREVSGKAKKRTSGSDAQ